ncbi:MAG: putative S-layer protein [Nanoarchaeota archaeon]|nr:putative S-layer protein [Nanoarchaeota archaeon]MBU1854087.1 putative S-layer protein [Nanoarchaeota archaeon]
MKIAKILVLLAIVLLATNFVSAQNLDILYVKINGETFDVADGNHTNNLKVERGDELEVRIRVQAVVDVDDVQLHALIAGSRYEEDFDDLYETTDSFDMSVGDVDNIDLDLKIPVTMDQGYYRLRLWVTDRDGNAYDQDYQLHIIGVGEEDAVVIKDYSFSPSSTINAGRAFTATVRVQNIGNDDLDDIKVTVSIPELNVKDSEYLDELEADEKETLEEFLLRIPDCAKPGSYDVEIEVEFDEYESTTETTQITVLPGDLCVAAGEGRTVVTVPEQQEFEAGSEIAYPIMIANQGTSAKTYTVAVSGVEAWGTSRLSPSSVVVVPGGTTKTIYLYVKADEGVAGQKVFIATVESEEDSEAFPLTANVISSENSAGGLKKGLEVALVVLVIILIIVGLIIGFNKLRGSEDEGTQTYY